MNLSTDLNIHHFRDFLCSHFCGYYWDLEKKNLPAGLPDCFLYTVKSGKSFRRNDVGGKSACYSERTISAAGAGLTKEKAITCAIGEAIERYTASFLDYSRSRVDFFHELDGEKLDPDLWIDRDVSFKSHKQRWVLGHKVIDKTPVWAPASAVWMFNGAIPDTNILTQVTSNGLSAGMTYDDAILGGLCELLERDALMVNWQIKQPLPHINIDSKLLDIVHPNFHAYLTGNDKNILIELYSMQFSCPIPIILAKLTLKNRSFGLILGASAKPTLSAAIEKAILETISVFFSAGARSLRMVDKTFDVDDIKDFIDHGIYYAFPQNAERTNFLFSEEVITLNTDSESLLCPKEANKLICQDLENQDISAHYVDITTEDLKLYGIKVVRCIAPGLEPLPYGKFKADKDHRRLEWIAKERGMYPLTYNNSLQPFA